MEAAIDFKKEAQERIDRIQKKLPFTIHCNGGVFPQGDNPTRAENQDPKEATEQLEMPPALIPRHMSREEWHNMERAAAKGMMPDETITPSRRMLYFTMVGLYAAVAADVMPVGVAKAEKRMAIEAFNRITADAEMFRRTGEFFKNVEAATTAYAKKACFKNAEAMYKAVFNAMPKKAHREEDWNDKRTAADDRSAEETTG